MSQHLRVLAGMSLVTRSALSSIMRESLVVGSSLYSHYDDIKEGIKSERVGENCVYPPHAQAANAEPSHETSSSSSSSTQSSSTAPLSTSPPGQLHHRQQQQQQHQEPTPPPLPPKKLREDAPAYANLGTSSVPTSRLSRAYNFTKLGASLAANRKDTSLSGDILASTLCRMRGGALKLGQMLSIQEESILPKEWVSALQKVRTGADAMPSEQVQQVMNDNYGGDWMAFMKDVPGGRGLMYLDPRALAAASIGQVHRGTLFNGQEVAVKIQYPGVAAGIESDLKNLEMLIRFGGFVPKGVFITEIIKAGREEMKNECDYNKEAANQVKFKQLITTDDELVRNGVCVPDVIAELTKSEVLVTEFVYGSTIDKAVSLPQATRNNIARSVLRLTLKELFTWRFMQTDPNWGNFLHDAHSGQTSLIDFGGARSFDEDFVDNYLKIVWAASNSAVDTLMKESITMKFLTGAENEIMLNAHRDAGMVLGEPFRSNEPFEFEHSRITQRISEHAQVFTKNRLVPPPSEVYTLHRKLAGAFLLCIKLKAVIPCRDILEEVWNEREGLRKMKMKGKKPEEERVE